MSPEITESSYRRQFHEPEFGADAAAALAATHGLGGKPRRLVEGSNLLFCVGKHWLKLYPPFWRDSFTTETKVLGAWADRLPVPIPRLLASGLFEGWCYVITSHVPGESFARIRPALSTGDRDNLALDLGALIAATAKLGRLGLNFAGKSWDEFVDAQIADAEAVHLARGCGSAWARQLAEFQAETKPLISALTSTVIVHGDLNHAHILMDPASRRVCGLIDFADAMEAPGQTELILPFLDCFRGDRARQRLLLSASGLSTPFAREDFARGFMALTLLNRFIRFDDWFEREIERLGNSSVTAIAKAVFPC